MKSVLHRVGHAQGAIALSTGAASALAQGGYPNRPVRITIGGSC